jgi:lipoprotein-releasing system permease protein
LRLPLFIARRYFFSRRNTTAVNIITLISVLGYAVGAFALIVLLSAMNGFENLIFKVYENYYADIKLSPVSGKVIPVDSAFLKKLNKVNGVKECAFVLEENAVVQNQDNQVVALVKGVGNNWQRVVKTDSLVVAGTPVFATKEGQNLAWMAEGLLYKLGIGGESSGISVMAPRREMVGVSQLDMNEDNIHVGAMIRAGDEMNQKLLVVPLEWAQALFEREGFIGGYEIKVSSPEKLNAVKQEIIKLAGPEIRVKDRYEQNVAVYKMFNTEKWVAFSIMAFVLLLISFNLIGSLSMLVLEKKNNIKTLKYLGMKEGNIKGVFLNEGVIVALFGTSLGLILGIAIVLLQQQYGFVTTQSTFAVVYPVELRFTDILVIGGLSSLLGFSSSVYPALKSTQTI